MAPVGAECRVFNKSLTLPSNTGNSFVLPCGIDGLECNGQCEDYEVRYRCSANEGRLHNSRSKKL